MPVLCGVQNYAELFRKWRPLRTNKGADGDFFEAGLQERIDETDFVFDGNVLRGLQNIKIPFMMSSDFKIGGIEDEDIDTGSEWRILTDGGLGCSFG